MNKYINYILILILTLSLGLFLNYIQYIKDISYNLYFGSFIYISLFILILIFNLLLFFTEPIFIFLANSLLLVFLFVFNINNDFLKSSFSMIISGLVLSILIGLYIVIANGMFNYKIFIPIVILIAIIIIIYVKNLNDKKEKERYIMECFCEKRKKKLINNFNGPCMTSDNTWGYIKDGKCISGIKKCPIVKKKGVESKAIKSKSVKSNLKKIKEKKVSEYDKLQSKIKRIKLYTEANIKTDEENAVNTLPHPSNDDFNFWCKYSNGLGFNAKSVNKIKNNPGYSTAECSTDIENGIDNYYLYTDCFKNDDSYTPDQYNKLCSEKIPGSFYDSESIGAYNCPVGQVRYKCKIKPLNFNNYSDCFNFNPSKPKSYYDNVCSQKFKSNAYYVNNTIGKYDCHGNNVKIKCETYPKKCL